MNYYLVACDYANLAVDYWRRYSTFIKIRVRPLFSDHLERSMIPKVDNIRGLCHSILKLSTKYYSWLIWSIFCACYKCVYIEIAESGTMYKAEDIVE